MIQIAKQAHHAGSVGQKAAAKFEFQIFGTRSSEISIKVNAVGNFRHHCFAEAYRKPMIVILQNCAVGVTACIRRVVIRSVVVHSPVQELQVAVGAVGIQVEEIDDVEFAHAELEPARGKRRREMKRVAFCFDTLVGERNDLPHHGASEIRCL